MTYCTNAPIVVIQYYMLNGGSTKQKHQRKSSNKTRYLVLTHVRTLTDSHYLRIKEPSSHSLLINTKDRAKRHYCVAREKCVRCYISKITPVYSSVTRRLRSKIAHNEIPTSLSLLLLLLQTELSKDQPTTVLRKVNTSLGMTEAVHMGINALYL